MFYGFHKPPSLLTEKGGGGGGAGVRNFKQLSLGYAKELKVFLFFFFRDRKLKGKLMGGMRNWVSG